MRVGVLGASGLVGGQILRFLEERAFPVTSLRAFASSRSAGKQVPWNGGEVTIEDAATADWTGLDIMLSSPGASVSLELSPKIAAAGAIVIDNTSAWRLDPDVPLVVPEVNAHALANIPKGIVANPNCTTMVCMAPLGALHRVAVLRRLIVSTYQSISGGGVAAVNELASQVATAGEKARELTWNGSAVDVGEPSSFTDTIAYNVLPDAGFGLDNGTHGETKEERKFRDESRKILEIDDLDVICTCVRVPVYTGHSVSLVAEFDRPLSPEDAADVLRDAPGVELVDVPTPLRAAGVDNSLVGRIRQAGAPERLALFVSGDNLRKGAALNAVQIAEHLLPSA